MGKKRRSEVVDLESERTLYGSFVASANALSQLYSSAVGQQRRASAAASKQTLVRGTKLLNSGLLCFAGCVVGGHGFRQAGGNKKQGLRLCIITLPTPWQERVLAWALREYNSTDAIPKAALYQFLQQEYEVCAVKAKPASRCKLASLLQHLTSLQRTCCARAQAGVNFLHQNQHSRSDFLRAYCHACLSWCIAERRGLRAHATPLPSYAFTNTRCSRYLCGTQCLFCTLLACCKHFALHFMQMLRSLREFTCSASINLCQLLLRAPLGALRTGVTADVEPSPQQLQPLLQQQAAPGSTRPLTCHNSHHTAGGMTGGGGGGGGSGVAPLGFRWSCVGGSVSGGAAPSFKRSGGGGTTLTTAMDAAVTSTCTGQQQLHGGGYVPPQGMDSQMALSPSSHGNHSEQR
jgi:hypothetical protein